MNSVIVSAVAVMAIGAGTSGQGIVRAWGFNDYGQCNVPADLGPCTAVAGGGNHTVALRTDGTVRAWGWNGYGQGTIPADLGPCIAVAAGGYHTVALTRILLTDSDGDGRPAATDNCPTVFNPSQADCDGSGVGDACQTGFTDFNANGIPDYCECIADLFVDGQVNGGDLGALLSQWGAATTTTASDLNRDGIVNGFDLSYLLSTWGPCPN